MKKYLKPAISKVNIDEVIMAAMSVHDEIGGGQLGKEAFFEDEEAPAAGRSVWDE